MVLDYRWLHTRRRGWPDTSQNEAPNTGGLATTLHGRWVSILGEIHTKPIVHVYILLSQALTGSIFGFGTDTQHDAEKAQRLDNPAESPPGDAYPRHMLDSINTSNDFPKEKKVHIDFWWLSHTSVIYDAVSSGVSRVPQSSSSPTSLHLTEVFSVFIFALTFLMPPAWCSHMSA